jgi:hypothetical protein
MPRLDMVRQQVVLLRALNANGQAGFEDTPIEWLLGEAIRTADLTALVVCLPAVLAVLLLMLPGRSGAVLGLLCGALILDVYAYQRFYYPTIGEINAFGVAAISLIVALLAPRIPRPRLLGRLVAGTLAMLVVLRLAGFVTDLAPAFEANDEASRRVQSAIDASDRTLFLIPNNEYRPMTVDSSIQKGGAATTDREPWGSPVVERLFGTHRAYLMGDSLAARVDPTLSRYDETFPTSLDLTPYDVIVYVAIDEEQTRMLLKETFGTTLDGRRCDERIPTWSPNVVGRGAPFHSSQLELLATTIVLCRPSA